MEKSAAKIVTGAWRWKDGREKEAVDSGGEGAGAEKALGGQTR
jgi:hypothetical protein